MTATLSRHPHSPAQPRQRRAGDILRGLASAAVLLAMLAGTPWLLLHAGWPLVPTWLHGATGAADVVQRLLTTRDDGSLFLGVLTAAGWVAWATFTAATALEAVTAVLRLGPLRVPLLAPQQRLVSGLVASVLVMLTGSLAVATPPAGTAPVTAPATASATGAGPTDSAPEFVLVQRGDTLWQVAEAELGQGAAYPRIVEATRGLVQPDGQTLQDPDRIYPGWTLAVPQTSRDVPAVPSTPAPSDDVEGEGAAGPPTAGPVATDAPSPAASSAASAPPAASAAPAPTSAAAEGAAEPDDDLDLVHGEVVEVAAIGGIGILTAAGLIALLRRRRARQRRTRRTGQHLPAAAPEVQEAQGRWIATQAPVTAGNLDSALRSMARECQLRGVSLPRLRHVRLVTGHVELHLESPMTPVEPFSAVGEQDVMWTATHAALAAAPTLGWEDQTAPYPALVAVGTDLDGAEVLIDLEQAGVLAVHGGDVTALPVPPQGPPAVVSIESVTAALLVELATSPWGQLLDVVSVGGADDLVAALDVDRVRGTGGGVTVESVCVQLEAWARGVHTVTSALEDDDPLDARRQDHLSEWLMPRVLLLGAADAEARDRLFSLASRLRSEVPILPLTVVTAGAPAAPSAASSSRWDLSLNPTTGLARLQPTALTLHPHHLDAATRRHAVDTLLATMEAPTATARTAAPNPASPSASPVAVPPVAQVGPVATSPVPTQTERRAHLSVPAPASGGSGPPAVGAAAGPLATTSSASAADSAAGGGHPVIAVLGPVEVRGARGELSAERHRGSMLEALAFMALHPHRTRYPFDRALWPDERVPDARRQQLVSRARRWLGTDVDGTPYVMPVNPHGYVLADAVSTDWDHFQALAASPLTAPTADLERALDLVRGQPFSGQHPRRYGWADNDAAEMIDAIADVAHELAVRAQRDGDAPRARRAALKGLSVEPSSEQLWRDALGAEALAGNRAGVVALMDRFDALVEDLGGDVEPETDVLLRDLYQRIVRPAPVPTRGDRHDA